MLHCITHAEENTVEKALPWRTIETAARSLGLTVPVSTSALAGSLRSLRVEWEAATLSHPVDQVILERTAIYQRSTMSVAESRWLAAHAVGHVLLHREQDNFACLTGMATELERSAELFAGFLLLGAPDPFGDSLDPQEIAKEAQVPIERVCHWLTLMRSERASRLDRRHLRLIRQEGYVLAP